ncbi:MAG TPA: biotin synthase BioB [Gammaproteobacteria bacterium]|nr:biotin synthase BioB [Gammaproteobacteria bacterium]
MASTARIEREARWTNSAVLAFYEKPFLDLIYQAQTIHRQYFPDQTMQLSTLLNVKTGGCPEDCHYCPQAARYHTGVKAEKLMSVAEVRKQAQAAADAGATRFCMGAAWRELKDRDLPKVIQLLKAVKALGMETCMTLGMLTAEQAAALQEAGLDFYNHNLDTSPEYYSEIITTRSYDERLQTLAHVRASGMKVCCGGIIGLGERREDRAAMLTVLANMEPYPESIPINHLVPIPGTPLQDTPPLDAFEFVRTIAIARIMMPKARVRLSAGRTAMSPELQGLCFLAGANSIFYGEKLLMTANPQRAQDRALLNKLGIAIAEV